VLPRGDRARSVPALLACSPADLRAEFDDPYTDAVLQQTLESVVPALQPRLSAAALLRAFIESSAPQQGQHRSIADEMLGSSSKKERSEREKEEEEGQRAQLVTAMVGVAQERRLRLLSALVSALGPVASLHGAAALLLVEHVTYGRGDGGKEESVAAMQGLSRAEKRALLKAEAEAQRASSLKLAHALFCKFPVAAMLGCRACGSAVAAGVAR